MQTERSIVTSAQRKRWTRTAYQNLGELGVFEPDERVELVEGEIVQRTPQGSGHATAILLASESMRRYLEAAHVFRVQLPLALGESSQPEPDLAVVPGDVRDFKDTHPSQAAFVIEVADATLEYDRKTKGPLYARAAIPEYWIVNLIDRQVEIYRHPGRLKESPIGYGYRLRQVAAAGDEIIPPCCCDRPVAVDDLLP